MIQRDEHTAQPRLYYSKLPACITDSKTHVLLVDPMLATGGSAVCAIQVLVDAGVSPTNITLLNVLVCPEGVLKVNQFFPGLFNFIFSLICVFCLDVKIVTASMDEGLNERKFILPGLGDFGDRYYGT